MGQAKGAKHAGRLFSMQPARFHADEGVRG